MNDKKLGFNKTNIFSAYRLRSTRSKKSGIDIKLSKTHVNKNGTGDWIYLNMLPHF